MSCLDEPIFFDMIPMNKTVLKIVEPEDAYMCILRIWNEANNEPWKDIVYDFACPELIFIDMENRMFTSNFECHLVVMHESFYI